VEQDTLRKAIAVAVALCSRQTMRKNRVLAPTVWGILMKTPEMPIEQKKLSLQRALNFKLAFETRDEELMCLIQFEECHYCTTYHQIQCKEGNCESRDCQEGYPCEVHECNFCPLFQETLCTQHDCYDELPYGIMNAAAISDKSEDWDCIKGIAMAEKFITAIENHIRCPEHYDIEHQFD